MNFVKTLVLDDGSENMEVDVDVTDDGTYNSETKTKTKTNI